jgi:hypothetical protein
MTGLLVISASKFPAGRAVEAIAALINASEVGILNAAGPRASGWPQGNAHRRAIIGKLLQSASSQRVTSRD